MKKIPQAYAFFLLLMMGTPSFVEEGHAITPQPRHVATGLDHSCAIWKGQLTCWGNNLYGNLVPPLLSSLTSLAAGQRHTCAIADGKLSCWGTYDARVDVLSIYLQPPFTQVAAGGAGACIVNSAHQAICMGGAFDRTNPPHTNVASIAMGFTHACRLLLSGEVKCEGADYYGKTQVPPAVSKASFVAVGNDDSCAVQEGAAICWGRNDGSIHNFLASIDEPIRTIALPRHDACALLVNGTVTCKNTMPPTNLTGVQELSGSGTGQVCALTATQVICWGDNTHSQATVPQKLRAQPPTNTRTHDPCKGCTML